MPRYIDSLAPQVGPSNVLHPTSISREELAPRSYRSDMNGGTRQRLRPWLESQVNSARIPQLEWLDKPNRIFKVPWKHAGKPGFVLDRDAVLFREWARHTGKYRDGEQPDPSTWKTRFRCAINKLPDIEEIKSKSNLDGDEPHRVFQFLPKGTIKSEKTEQPVNSPYSDESYSATSSPLTSDIKPEENVCIGYKIDAFSGIDEVSQVNDVDLMQQDLIHNFELPSDYNYNEQFAYSPESSDVAMCPFQNLLSEPTSMPNPLLDMIELLGFNPEEMELAIKIYYKGNLAGETVVKNRIGCRLHSGANLAHLEELRHLFGPGDVEQIQFPPLNSPIMETVHRGLLLQWEDNNIVATRYCRAHVYASTSAQPLIRGEPTRVFDYELFLAGLAECHLNHAPLPVYEVFFGFGQEPSTTSTVDPAVPITVSLTHLTAKASISRMGSGHEVNLSAENEDDLLAIQLQRMVLQPQQMVPAPQ